MRAAEADPQSGGALRLLYEATVEEVDARLVGPLLVELDRLGIAERTIFALVSDHGEEFQEHGALFHGRHVWSELVDVPLLLRGPGVPAAARRGDAAHLEDVAPTIAARLGLEPDVRCFGRDLFAAADADPADPRARVLHLDHRDQLGNYRWDGLLFGRHAFLRQQLDDGAVRQHLFDLHEDPAELLDLASDRGDLCAGLARRLDAEMAAWLDFAARLPDPQRPFHGEREQLERRLEELGYAAR